MIHTSGVYVCDKLRENIIVVAIVCFSGGGAITESEYQALKSSETVGLSLEGIPGRETFLAKGWVK